MEHTETTVEQPRHPDANPTHTVGLGPPDSESDNLPDFDAIEYNRLEDEDPDGQSEGNAS